MVGKELGTVASRLQLWVELLPSEGSGCFGTPDDVQKTGCLHARRDVLLWPLQGDIWEFRASKEVLLSHIFGR